MKIKMTQNKIHVLDNGHVEYIDHMGNDLTVVNAARVSFNKESDWDSDPNWTGSREFKLSSKDTKLIDYLATHKHWTPFAHPQITLRIKAPIFIRAQLGKHQVGLVMNEVSRRYVTYEPEFYIPMWRSAPTNGAKQGSSGFMKHVTHLTDTFQNLCDDAMDTYKELIAQGVAPEQARAALPQSMYTEWWWTGSLAAFARIYAQRVEEHAQWEVQQYANAIGTIIEPLFPVSWKALTITTK
jgi:thymidylate synthase (FAD)